MPARLDFPVRQMGHLASVGVGHPRLPRRVAIEAERLPPARVEKARGSTGASQSRGTREYVGAARDKLACIAATRHTPHLVDLPRLPAARQHAARYVRLRDSLVAPSVSTASLVSSMAAIDIFMAAENVLAIITM